MPDGPVRRRIGNTEIELTRAFEGDAPLVRLLTELVLESLDAPPGGGDRAPLAEEKP